ncbi:MAG TPA: helix-hairpin-helix domain-containing protein [Candidatus Polarisedimenticolia bacterium]|nr:helix-hairpin-helix domain-containing protein [Candidatus Polarisedimenticolia bacterium]
MPPRLNPAAFLKFLTFGVGILVFLFLASQTFAAKKHPPSKPVDLNTATVQELEQLPGIGPTTAKAIVQFRAKSGRFRRVEDLLAVRGISEAKLQKLRPYITVGPPAGRTP